ncbi:TIGR03545 family protein [Calditrichota bacterium LG25]
MIRWKGVILLAALVVLFLALSMIFTDRWLEAKLEASGSALVGARVEIDDLDFSFFGSHLKFKGLRVTNPRNTMRNLFETGACELNFEFWPLLSKKIIVENFQISGFKTNTPRQTDGALPEKPIGKKKANNIISKSLKRVAQNMEQNAGLSLSDARAKMNVDSLIRVLQFESPRKIDSLQKALSQSFEKWNKKLKNARYEQDFKELEAQIKKLDIKNIKTLKNLQKTLNTLNSVKKKIALLSDSIRATETALQKELQSLQASVAQVERWIEQDYRRALSRARIPEITRRNIGQLLFGKSLVNRLENYLSYVQTGRRYLTRLKSDAPKKENPPRFKGQDIYFYSPHGRPDFWIRQIRLSGQTHDNLQLAGQILDIVSDQRFIHRPTVIKISGQSAGDRSFVLNGKLNYLKEVPHETFDLLYQGFSLNNTQISDSPYFPFTVKKGRGTLKAQLTLSGDTVKTEIRFLATGLELTPTADQKLNYAQQLTLDVFRSLKTLTIKAKISGQAGRWKIQLNSNADEALARRLKEKLSAEVEKAKARVEAEIKKKTDPSKQRFLTFVARHQKDLEKQLQKYESELRKVEAELKKREHEIKQRIEKEKKKTGKNVQEKLKKLLK